ncbi:CheR family methyltransferase [Consotaella salsifontis]|uniref:Chemotaxis protein methyltransferase n=1 Tax=Consotaella salsifontis TaxID=1365950 RepID=A0A1T4STC7_9HYPH|nr:CheR family methyltransferase [Consotaella salsifontis]SKA31524.1 MCP methyltransferase, CheR-type [Consotaella salsifontis]
MSALASEGQGAEGPPHPLSDEELAKFSEFFYRKTGIRLDERKRYYMERRIVERIRRTGCRSFFEYFTTLKLNGAAGELEALINEMTVNETYFWRENYQFECMTRSMLDEIARRKRPGEPIRIWSIPCSTGEEPYTIAIHILEYWARADSYDIEIFASDIDSNVLKRARDGTYDERSLSRLPPQLRARYFKLVSERRWQVINELRSSIAFGSVNLSDPLETARYRQIDLIFCRNLLIYFDDVSRRLAAENMFEAMSPGGFICLGHSESMSRITNLFRPRQFAEALVYQKPAPSRGA